MKEERVLQERRYRLILVTPEVLFDLLLNGALTRPIGASSARPRPRADSQPKSQEGTAFLENGHVISVLHELGLGSHCHYLTVFSGVPENAELVGASYDIYKRVFVLCVYSATYDPVPDAEMIPEQIVTVHQKVIAVAGTEAKPLTPVTK